MSKSVSTKLATLAAAILVSSLPANAALDSSRIITKCDGVVAGFTCGKETTTEVKTVKQGEGIGGGDHAVLITFPGGYNAPKGKAGFTVSNLIPPKQAYVLHGFELKMAGSFAKSELHSKALARKGTTKETYVVDGKLKNSQGDWTRFEFPIPNPDTLVAVSVWGESRGGRDVAKNLKLEDVRADYGGKGVEYVIPTQVSTRNDGCDGVNPK